MEGVFIVTALVFVATTLTAMVVWDQRHDRTPPAARQGRDSLTVKRLSDTMPHTRLRLKETPPAR